MSGNRLTADEVGTIGMNLDWAGKERLGINCTICGMTGGSCGSVLQVGGIAPGLS